jgi:hypothetical protein
MCLRGNTILKNAAGKFIHDLRGIAVKKKILAICDDDKGLL